MLESLLNSLQVTIQKREIKEQQVKELLEKEIERLKNEKVFCCVDVSKGILTCPRY